jgi:hypothetical protein
VPESPRKLRRIAAVAAAAAVIAVAAALGGGTPAQGVAQYGITQYFSGVVPPSTNVWDSGWNYYRYNWNFNTNSGSGPLVRVQEHLTSGSWVYTYTGHGQIDICHTRTYTETGCANVSSSYISMTCYKETDLC